MNDFLRYGIDDEMLEEILEDCRRKGIDQQDTQIGLKLIFQTLFGTNENVSENEIKRFAGVA